MSGAAAAMLDVLQRWRSAGALRALDVALARLLHELDAEAPASLLLAGALAAQMEGRGHDCVELAQLTPASAADMLGWTAPTADELAAVVPDWAAEHGAWSASPLIDVDPENHPKSPVRRSWSSPLVLHRGRLYLRRYWTWESRVAAQVRARTSPEAIADLPVDAIEARRWLDRLFPTPPRAKGRGAKESEPPVDWQKFACALALQGRFTVITGGPGTGKTTTAARLLVLMQALHRGRHPLRVALAAPTGKAAARLRQAIDTALAELRRTIEPDLFGHDPTAPPGAARTLHALLGARPGTRRFRHDASEPLEVDVLFVDEASMVHLEMMDALLDALPPHARVVLLGDKDQLASVEAGAVLGDLCAGAEAGGYTADTLRQVQALAGITVPARYARSGGDGAGAGDGADSGDGGDSADSEDSASASLAQHTAMLRVSHRFGGAIGELAVAVNRGDAAAVRERLTSRTDRAVVHAPAAHEGAALRTLALEGRDGAPGYRACFEQLRERPADPEAFEAWALSVLSAFDRLRVLCAVREGPQGVETVNTVIEQALADAKLLPARRGEWYEGRPVMVTRNDPALGVFNGDIGIALRPPGRSPAMPSVKQSVKSSVTPSAAAPAKPPAPAEPPLRVYFLDAGALRSVSSSRLADVQTAFALTVHKSQGSEFEHVLLLLPREDVPVLTRELLYTAVTRAKAAFTLATAEPALVETAVRRLTRRGSGLRELLAAREAAA
ncbi:MAG: exodeoxyribonuclease V subunit alpha [Burkholderiales bacterium]|nr:exodeoxyribonuclease V subunit alpha [Burkholderiales bacterium]